MWSLDEITTTFSKASPPTLNEIISSTREIFYLWKYGCRLIFIPGKVVSPTVRVIYNIWKIDLSVNITLDHVYVRSIYHHHNVKSPEKLTVHTTVLYTPITTNTKCIIFYHGTIYSLIMFILSTTLEEGYIVLYLEITFTLVNKYLSDPAVIIKCHLDQN